MVSLKQKSAPSKAIKPVRTYSSVRDVRLWAGVGLLVVCALIGRATIHEASARTGAVVVVNNLAKGAVIRAQDVQLAQVSVPNAEALPKELSLVVGQRTKTDLYEGEVVSAHDVGTVDAQPMREVTVPLRAGHVPNLAYGDRVDVWVTPSTTGVALPGPAHVIATSVLVRVAPDVIDATTDTSVTLSVPLNKVQALVQATQDGFIDVVTVPFENPEQVAS